MMMKRAPSPSRLPHRRIAAWARELMDDLQSIEEAHSGHQPTESGEDPGEPLAIKRFAFLPFFLSSIIFYLIILKDFFFSYKKTG